MESGSGIGGGPEFDHLGHVDFNSTIIEQNLPDGHYACTEKDGNVVIRNLKEESRQWEKNRDVFWSESSRFYPYCHSFNFQYMEMYHWSESNPYWCDYEKDGCHIKEGDVVVDIGANIGIFSRMVIEKGAEKVYAFEPSMDAMKCLLLNVDRSMVDVYKACIYSHTGFLDVRVTEESFPMASVDDHRTISNTENVSCYTLDDLFDFGLLPDKIDFMKVDVEGAECHVFDGLSDENLTRIDRLAVETHHHPEGHVLCDQDNITKLLVRITGEFLGGSRQMTYGNSGGRSWTQTINAWR